MTKCAYRLELMKSSSSTMAYSRQTDCLTHLAGPKARQTVVDRLGEQPIRMDVNCFMIRGPDGITLIDAGCGTGWGPDFGNARIHLNTYGVAPGDVRRVLLTHLHGDHALGLFGVNETPYFPNADVWAPQGDLSFYTDLATFNRTPDTRRCNFKVAAALLKIYGSKVKPLPDGPVIHGIDPHPLPGHSPGHTGFLLRGDKDSLLVFGDALHLPDTQSADPNIGIIYDIDTASAASSRRAMLEDADREDWIIAGGHLTGFGRVRRNQNGWQIDTA